MAGIVVKQTTDSDAEDDTEIVSKMRQLAPRLRSIEQFVQADSCW